MKLSIIFIAILNSHSSNSGPFGFFDPNGLSIFHNLVIPKDFDINNPKSFKCFNVTNTFDGEHWNPFTVPLSDMFNRFLIKYNKKYSKEEVLLRKANMYRAMLAIAGSILKCHSHEIGHTCNFGLTSISDMSTDEFKRLCGTKPSKHSKVKINPNSKQLRSTISNAVCQPKTTGSLPQSLDWRNINSANCLTPVQNQGSCGNCWDFSTTSTIESQKLIKTGCPKPPNINYDLSEQDLLNCVSDSDCNGGYIDSAMAYVVANCQATAAAVPYVKKNTCNHYPLVNGTCISNYCEKGGTAVLKQFNTITN